MFWNPVGLDLLETRLVCLLVSPSGIGNIYNNKQMHEDFDMMGGALENKTNNTVREI